MKVELRMIGKTGLQYLKEGIEIYENRIKHYLSFDMQIIPDLKNSKNLSPEQIKQQEGLLILRKLQEGDFLILLDEKGKALSSAGFAQFIEKQLYSSKRRIIFQVGGAYGFSDEVYRRADEKLSLSKMTFSHQLIRLIFVEQLYRALTIIKGEPYHNP
jgi:23S rRNA (pseudouridine1915-N3)-methyltransferase